jgi:tetratricopeptide (TPR) repeat protein
MLTSPAFVCSVPKSGTHLILGILRSVFGDDQVYELNDKKAGNQILTENDILDMPQFDKKIYVGHFAYSDELSSQIKDFKKILLVRDPRDYVISMAYYMNYSTNFYYRRLQSWENKISSIILGMRVQSVVQNHGLFSLNDTFTKYFLDWILNNTDSMVVRFEDIVDKQFGGDDDRKLRTIRSIIRFLNCVPDFNDQSLMEKIEEGSKPEKSSTFRKSKNKIGSWRGEFTPRNIMQFKKVAPHLVSALGYEKDENWNNEPNGQYSDRYEVNREILENRERQFPVIERYYELLKINSFLASSYNLPYSPCTQQDIELINDWALRQLIEEDDYPKCLPILDILLSIRPEEAEWNYYRGFCLMQLQNDSEVLLRAALRHFNIALQNGYNEFWTLYNRGHLFYKLHELENSIADLQKATSLDPSHNGAKNLLRLAETSLDSEKRSHGHMGKTRGDPTLFSKIQTIRSLVKESDFEKAITNLRKLLRNTSNHPELNYLYAFCLHQQRKDARQALLYYDKAFKNGFNEFYIKHNRASLFIYLGEFDAARADISRALELNYGAKESLALLTENLLQKERLVAATKPKSSQ